jgi:heme exporter protein C
MSRWLAAHSFTSAIGFALLLATTGWMIFVFAPQETTMGDVQRIVYLHVAVAWCGLAGCLAMGVAGAMYLLNSRPAWDHWSQAAGEIGWLCTTLTLVTGSLWAHEAWNTWWTWEPRLTASLILWTLFAAYFLVRGSIETAERRARLSAVVAILTLADLPLVVMATRWFRGIHPVSPEMDGSMRLALLVTVASFTLLFAWLVAVRRQQLSLAARLSALS